MERDELLKIIKKARRNKSTILDLSSRYIKELPPEIGQLTKLTKLFLYNNKLTSLPKEIGELTNLMILYLFDNQLTSLPNEIGELTKLTELHLYDNQLTSIPPEIGELNKLMKLDLSSNKLTSLPPEIGQLSNLTELYLSGNKLTSLFPEIGQLIKLTVLGLYNNQLTSIPPEIGQLTKLTVLGLYNNQLTSIPPEIGQLTKLTGLDLSNNQLTSMPPEIGQLTNLKELVLCYNPLKSPPPEIVKQGIDGIRDYLIGLKKETEGKELYEAKMLIVGQGGVGKTCLMKRLLYNTYNYKEDTTHGIEIEKWEIQSPENKNIKITLNIWDFGGQEIYHATHQFFLTSRSLYILVWDARQEEEYGRIDYWLNTIETFAGDSPIIIVLNKSDERIKDLNLKDLKKRFPQIVDSYKISCKKGHGIEELKKVIQKTAWSLPLMKTFWFSSWLKIRRILEKDPRNQMAYTEYLELCLDHNIEEKEARSLSQYLHDLGIILHFHEDILLKDTIILKPDWGTNAVYAVLDSRTVQQRNGILLNRDLPDIWLDKKLYPADKYATLLQLMSNFELSFQIGRGNKHIVAELLPPQQLDFEWNSLENLQFEFHYDFLPAGVMTRFIVRMHEYLIKKDGKNLCWREGAFLEKDDTSAFVKRFPIDKKIEIKINGKLKRELLAVVRSHFDAIHDTIHKIRVKEMIPCNCEPDCSHRYDYKFLLRLEEKGKDTVTCQRTIEDVDLKSLLDGIENSAERRNRYVKDLKKIYEFEREPKVVELKKPKKKWYKSVWAIIGVIYIILGCLAALFYLFESKTVRKIFHKSDKHIEEEVKNESEITVTEKDSSGIEKKN